MMTNSGHASALLSTILTFLLFPAVSSAQGPAAVSDLRVEGGSVGGTVKDPSSALIPGTTVTLTNTQTGVTISEKTNAEGRYDFTNVLPGFYRLSGELSGFTPEVRNIQIVGSNQFRVDLVLRVGGVATIRPSMEGTRLVWTAVPGTGNTYVIERSGPGLTLFTPVAGPISETSYFIDTSGSDFDKGATYQYRIRTVDSAQNTGEPSTTVSVRSSRNKDLPLVGTNVLDLLSVLPGYVNNGAALRPDDAGNRSFALESPRPDSISLIFTGTSNRTLSFTIPDGSQTFSWGCPDCSFVVGPGGVAPASAGSRGAMFKLSLDGSTVQVTCRAVRCDVLSARQIETDKGLLRASGNVVERQLGTEETMTIPATQRAFFSVNTR